MEIHLECEKVRRIELFVRDQQKYERVVATVARLLNASSYGEAERSLTSEDVVGQLIADALCGTRTWNMDEMHEFDGWMITQVRSIRFNLVRKLIRPAALNREDATIIPDLRESEMILRPDVSLERELIPNGFEPCGEEDHVCEFENREVVKEVKRALESKGDVTAFLVFEEVLIGKPGEEITFSLGLQISDVRNAKKRIKRMIDKVQRDIHHSKWS